MRADKTSGRMWNMLYMAPEVVKGHKPTQKVDVFSFGIVLYELLGRSLLTVYLQGEDETEAEALASYAARVSEGHREDIPERWPPEVGGAGLRPPAGARRRGRACGRQPAAAARLPTAGLAAPAAATGSPRAPVSSAWPRPSPRARPGRRRRRPAHCHRGRRRRAQVRQLLASCWAQEPHMRPRMGQVARIIQEWTLDWSLIERLDPLLPGDPGGPMRGDGLLLAAEGPGCGCVIS
jgi:serine/threonine protein kinase